MNKEEFMNHIDKALEKGFSALMETFNHNGIENKMPVCVDVTSALSTLVYLRERANDNLLFRNDSLLFKNDEVS